MPALPADILRATRQARVVTRSDGTIQSTYVGARDGGESPELGYFESASDASACLTLKAALGGQFRRRFAVSLADELWIDPLSGVPTFHLVDAEHGADLDVLVTRIQVDMENETTSLGVLG